MMGVYLFFCTIVAIAGCVYAYNTSEKFTAFDILECLIIWFAFAPVMVFICVCHVLSNWEIKKMTTEKHKGGDRQTFRKEE